MDIEQVLQFWFGERINSATPSAQANLWWRKQPEVDQQIREDFADGLRDLAEGKYRDWLHSARGQVGGHYCAGPVLEKYVPRQTRSFCSG